MSSEATVMTKEPDSVSPYLLRRLRSYQEALRDRIRRRLQHRQLQDRAGERPNEAPEAAKPSRRRDSESDRDV